eukprot:TRINITY_DN2426_c0_g1_i1.p1 TRINITY_DN2426_c0_g1~~TRINITY_DN2426_c0_g1_i1.p1  ORF type:complete len:404 (-),score=88.69 TRINITY_DN2426_c0_g1_i1:65-1276(-)
MKEIGSLENLSMEQITSVIAEKEANNEVSQPQVEPDLSQITFQPQALNPESFAKPIPASKLREHIQILLDAKDPNFSEINGFDIEFNYIETQTAQEQYYGDYKTALISFNKNKNRYSNVLPPEKTRVKLKVIEGEEGSDYINGNYISGLIPNSERAYVATQGPLQATFGDFWRMIWETDATVIVMLTKEVENGKLKCDRYWPDLDCPVSSYPFKVALESQDEASNELTTRKFTLHNIVTDESREITQFQYTAWPDHGLPVSTTAFLDLAHKADTASKTAGPIVVHCSAGIGRSGTFCTVHSIVEKLRLDLEQHPDVEPEFNIVKTVLFMREQRPGMVQTKEQYMFVYLTLLEECERLFNSREQAKKLANEALEETKAEDPSARNDTTKTSSNTVFAKDEGAAS